MAGARCAWSPSCQAEGSLLGRGEHQGTTPGSLMAHTPPIRVTVAGLLLTLAGYSHARGSCRSACHGSWARMQRHDRCAGAGGTASDTEGLVCAAQEEKKKKREKKNAGTGVFGSWGQRMTSHAMQCPFSWGLRRKNALRCPRGELM